MRSLASALALCLLATSPAGAQRGTYLVREGDTLAEIARRNHVTVDAIVEANALRRTRIRPGQRLRIPARSVDRRDVPAIRYRVRQGDSLVRIARRHHVSVEDLQTANELRGAPLRPGETLWVPRQGHSGAEVRERLRVGNPVVEPDVPPTFEPEVAGEVRARASELGLGSMAVGQRLLREPPDPRWVEVAGSTDDLEGTLLQPVESGRFLRGWGSGAEGYHLAIDIGARSGTEIRAAERGLVAYVGHEIRGYGNLVLIVHPNRWITAYAHNLRNLVTPGQLVERGHLLALVGETGYARGPHLHFFFVHDGRHCDPMPLLRPRLERPDGQEVESLELVWDAELRPSGIRCLLRRDAPHPTRHWRDGRSRPRRR